MASSTIQRTGKGDHSEIQFQCASADPDGLHRVSKYGATVHPHSHTQPLNQKMRPSESGLCQFLIRAMFDVEHIDSTLWQHLSSLEERSLIR
jgi:hypothetical protein